jgi:myosin protein heavy chain
MEKQNRELRDKLAELEEVAKGRSKSVIANLEAKVAAVEEQLHLEANEKHRIGREYKKSDKRLREMHSQIEEERKLTENYKEQVEKMQSKIKMNKRFIEENEEEITQLKNKNRKVQRDLEESNEQNDLLNQNLVALRQKHSKMTTASLLPSKIRNSTLSKLINETVGDFDDDDLDNTLSQTGLNDNSIKLETNGSNGTHNLSNVSSLNSSSSGHTKESPSS